MFHDLAQMSPEFHQQKRLDFFNHDESLQVCGQMHPLYRSTSTLYDLVGTRSIHLLYLSAIIPRHQVFFYVYHALLSTSNKLVSYLVFFSPHSPGVFLIAERP